MFGDFNLGIHVEVNHIFFKTKGAQNHPPTYGSNYVLKSYVNLWDDPWSN